VPQPKKKPLSFSKRKKSVVAPGGKKWGAGKGGGKRRIVGTGGGGSGRQKVLKKERGPGWTTRGSDSGERYVAIRQKIPAEKMREEILERDGRGMYGKNYLPQGRLRRWTDQGNRVQKK